jgi:hypothetical protein
MKLTDILEYKNLELYKEVVNNLNSKINGRVALNPDLQSTHVLYVIKDLMGYSCKTVLEIGTLWGGALLTMMQCKYESKFVSMDMFAGFYPDLLGEGNSDQNFGINTIELVTDNVNKNNPHQYEVDLIKGSSHGDHAKKGVIQDWEDYSSLITVGGIVVFDDYWVGDYERSAWKKEDDEGVKWMDVVGAVDEIINTKEFIENWRVVGLFGDKKIVERVS